MKRSFALLLTLLLTLNSTAAVYAEEEFAADTGSQEILLTEEETEILLAEEMSEFSETGNTQVSNETELRDALEAAVGNEMTIQLTANIFVSSDVTVPVGSTVILDMNGCTLGMSEDWSGTHWMLLNYGNLTITGGGAFTLGDGAGIVVNNVGTLTIESGTFSGFTPVYADSGRLTVMGGTFNAEGEGSSSFGLRSGIIEITGEPVCTGDMLFVFSGMDFELTIRGGTYTAFSDVFGVMENVEGTPNITIEGGSFTMGESTEVLLAALEDYIAAGATVTVNGMSYTKEDGTEEPEPDEPDVEIPEGEKLTGTTFGTDSWEDNEATAYDKAFDGDISTFYDAYDMTIEAHVGMDVKKPTRLTEVHIFPRNENGYEPQAVEVDGSDGYYPGEDYTNLFDGDLESGWCSAFVGDSMHINWQTTEPVSPDRYIMYTGYDTAIFPERSPITWTLSATNDPEGKWDVLDYQENNYDLPDENCASYEVTLGELASEEGYTYFKLAIDAVKDDSEGSIQLGEFRLLEAEAESVEEFLRMEGMTVQGSTDGKRWAELYTFSGDYRTVKPYVITADDMNLVNDYSFTQFRVINKQQHLNVAEVEFYGVDGSELEPYPSLPEEGEVLLTDDYAMFFGSDSWTGNFNVDGYYKAFDGDIETFYDATEDIPSNEAEIGITLGNPAQLTGIRVHPRGDNNEYRLSSLEIQGSVNGIDWIPLYRFNNVEEYVCDYYEVGSSELASAAQEYAFTQFRVISKTEHLNIAEVELYGTYNYSEDVEVFPMSVEEPIYSYLTADQFLDTAWVYYERDPENEDDDHYMDYWYFNDRDEEGMTPFEREFEGRKPIVLLGGVGFDDTKLEIQDIDGKPIIAVAPWAFAGEKGIVEVIIDDTSDCKYILNGAFWNCDIESVTVSNSLRRVDGDTFSFNERLHGFFKCDAPLTDEDLEQRDWAYVTVGEYNELISGDCLICYPPAKDPVDSYRVPDSIWSINVWAFWAAQIDEITMGHNVGEVNHGAFSDSTASTIILSPALRHLGNEAFAGCTNLTYLEIPSDKVEIDSWKNDNGETEYNDWIFGGTVDYENGETSETRTPLKVVSYADGVMDSYIGYIHKLTKEREDYDMSHVVFEETDEVIWYGFNWWGECGENEVFLVGYSAPFDAEITTMPTVTYDDKTIIGVCMESEVWSAFLFDDRVGGTEGTFTVPEGIRYLHGRPFAGCENLRVLELPASLEGADALNDRVPNLEKFVVAEGSEHFYTEDNGASLYSGDTYVSYAPAAGLETLTIKAGTRCIGYSSFQNVTDVPSISVPDSVESVENWAFQNSSLGSITLPEKLSYIGEEAFADCQNLTEVEILSLTSEFCEEDWGDDFRSVFANSNEALQVIVYKHTPAHAAAERYGWPLAEELPENEETYYDIYTANDGVHLAGVVPATVDGVAVTEFVIPEEVMVIDGNAFENVTVTSVTLPKNLRYIDSGTFEHCDADNLEVKFSGAVWFGWEGNSFPEGFDIELLYDEALLENQHWDGKYLYYVMPDAKEVVLRGYWYTAIDDNGVMEIPSETVIDGETYYVTAIEPGSCEAGSADRLGDHVRNHAEEFGWKIADSEWTYPKTIVLPDTVRYIGGDAFAHHNYWDEDNEVHYGLESVTLPREVKWIEHGAFYNSWLITEFKNLDAYGAESGNPYRLLEDGSIVSVWDEDYLHTYPAGRTASEYTVPDGIDVIGRCAFNNAKNLVSVTVPEGVRYIEEEAFAWCENLETISLPSTIEDFLHGSFRGCDSLTTILLPNGNDRYSVDETDGTLRADEGDTIAVLPLGIIPADGRYEISEGVKGLWSTSMASQRLTELVIPASMEWMNGLSFEDCGNLRKVTFKGTFEDNLPLSAFAYCHNLEEIVYYGAYVNMFVYDHDIADRTIATEHDENGDILRDEDGNEVTRKFDFRLMNAEAGISLFVIRNDDWENPDYETMYPDDNPYFSLIRGSEVILLGDVNTDERVDTLDRMNLARTIAGWTDMGYDWDKINETAADINKDGSVDGKDRMILARYLAKWTGYESLEGHESDE